MIGADEVDHPALDHRDRLPAQPHILAQQGTGGLGIFRDAPPHAVEDRMDHLTRGKAADRLPPHGVVRVRGLQGAVDLEFTHAAGGVVGVAVGLPGPRVRDHIARAVIGEAAAAAGGENRS